MPEIVYFTVPTPDADEARDFYAQVLGWEFAPGSVPNGFQISNVSPPGGLSGGDTRSDIQVYFGTDDIEEAVGRIRRLGGVAAEIVDGGHGRYVECKDSQGTSFSLYQPNEGA